MRHISKLLANIGGLWRTCGPAVALRYVGAILSSFPEVVRSRTLVAADARMHGRWSYRLQGVSIELDERYFAGAREMYCRQVYFPAAEFNLRPGTTVLDLGANAGLFSVLAAHVGCNVIAVEAQKGFTREIRALAQQQGISDRISIENAMVGAGGVLADQARLESASHFEGFAPRLVTMNELLQKHVIRTVDLLKIDIEGSEFALFRSDCGWLKVVRRISMEVHPAFGNPVEIETVLSTNGFTVQWRDEYLFAIRKQ